MTGVQTCALPICMMKTSSVSSPVDLITSVLSQDGNAQENLMNILAQKNPQGYQQVMDLMQSGQDPKQVINQLLNNMNPQQRQQLDNLARVFPKFR